MKGVDGRIEFLLVKMGIKLEDFPVGFDLMFQRLEDGERNHRWQEMKLARANGETWTMNIQISFDGSTKGEVVPREEKEQAIQRWSDRIDEMTPRPLNLREGLLKMQELAEKAKGVELKNPGDILNVPSMSEQTLEWKPYFTTEYLPSWYKVDREESKE